MLRSHLPGEPGEPPEVAPEAVPGEVDVRVAVVPVDANAIVAVLGEDPDL